MSHFLVSEEVAGQRLDLFVVAVCPHFSRSRIQALIASGHIRVAGIAVRAGHKVRPGDEVTVEEPAATPSELVPEEIPLVVLFEDDDLLVLNKPAGLVVHPGAGNASGTLVNALLHHCESLSGIGGVERPGIVHRLDKDTSGCLVVAKNDLAHRELSRQFAGRETTKRYLALAHGVPRVARGLIDAPIDRHPVDRKKMAVSAPGKGREAQTRYGIIQVLDRMSLLECRLLTGRTHQIRVHLKHLGHPLVGDPVYGRARDGFARQMLHAWKLGFVHPRSGASLEFTAPPPPDFLALPLDFSAYEPV